MTIEEMKEKKKELGYTLAQISEYSGVPLGTIQKIFNDEMMNPSQEMIQALEEVLRTGAFGELLREESAYRAKPRHTIEDYYALPDDKRVELIDGEFFEMAAPRTTHQALLRNLVFQVESFIRQGKAACKLYFAPTDVQLDEHDDTTMVQPDLLVVCDENKITERCIAGAPDFIIEILSSSTREKDAFIKANKYRQIGVREYWMVDIDKRRVILYYFEEDCLPTICGFDQAVPVRIYDGKLQIVFED